jgi:DNA polymerase-3 subunit gamma/tau
MYNGFMSQVDTIKPKTNQSTGLALYRKYRPRQLGDVVGQPQVTDVLSAAASSRNFAHAYLLTGQRGTGKTSVARILAHLIINQPYNDDQAADIDIIEIDAASNNSVDDVRELRDNIDLMPMRASHKIYIIDEVHMLSGSAFNALLKTIEEPPAHVVFILATTEVQKLPATILSRVQRFHFRPIATEMVAGYLGQIASEEKIDVDDEALLLIAERGSGSLRDSLTLLDQLARSERPIRRPVVEEILGLASLQVVVDIISAIQSHDAATAVRLLNEQLASGMSATVLTNQLIDELIKLAPEKPRLFSLIERLLEVAKSSSPDTKLMAILADASLKSSSVAVAASPARLLDKADGKTDSQLATIIEQDIAAEIKQTSSPPPLLEIDWSKIMSQVKKLNAPFASILKQANFDYHDGQLTLYFKHKLYRLKAETEKCRDVLSAAFQNLYQYLPSIVIAKTAQPTDASQNSLIAEVTAIMGGVEIISEPNRGQDG